MNMKKKEKKGDSGPPEMVTSCCAIKAMVTIDERGQMVLPKELRDEVGLKAGDKLAVVAMAEKGKVCCLTLLKADELSNMVMIKLKPVWNGIKEADKDEEQPD
jgi:AbrB family looped-hinge helix DNA binding protein